MRDLLQKVKACQWVALPFSSQVAHQPYISWPLSNKGEMLREESDESTEFGVQYKATTLLLFVDLHVTVFVIIFLMLPSLLIKIRYASLDPQTLIFLKMLMTFPAIKSLEDWKAMWLQEQLDYSALNSVNNESFLSLKLKLKNRGYISTLRNLNKFQKTYPLLKTSCHQSCSVAIQKHSKPPDTFKTPQSTCAELQIIRTPLTANWHDQMTEAVKDVELGYLLPRLAIGQKELEWTTLGSNWGTVFRRSETFPLWHMQTCHQTTKSIYD